MPYANTTEVLAMERQVSIVVVTRLNLWGLNPPDLPKRKSDAQLDDPSHYIIY